MIKSFMNKLVEAWPIVAAAIGIIATWYVQINMLEYRLKVVEQQVQIMSTDYKQNLESINKTIIEMKLDIRTLITIISKDKQLP